MQAMFGHLQESLRQYYNPKRFCEAYKDYDGRPIDVTVQMDVDEFFNVLCDKLDRILKGTMQVGYMSFPPNISSIIGFLTFLSN